MTEDDITRRAALKMLQRGNATVSEVAHLAGRSRQIVSHWAMRAGIDPSKNRHRLLARLWERVTRNGG